MIKQIADEHKALVAAEKEVERLRKVISDKLEEVKKEKGTSFRAGSNFYQIRARANAEGVKMNYICERKAVDGPFGSWLKGKGRKQVAARTAPAASEAPEAAQAAA